MGAVSRRLERLRRKRKAPRKITQWTRYLTIGLRPRRAGGVSLFSRAASTSGGNRRRSSTPGHELRALTGTTAFFSSRRAAVFIMWLGEQISIERGGASGTA